MSLPKKLTSLAERFLQPVNATHRQYEALRAYCVEGLPSAEAAARFGYTPGSFRVLVHQFRQDPERAFFLSSPKGPQTAPKRDRLRDRVIALRKQNLSIYDISRNLAHQGHPLSPVAVAQVLKEEGFARLPRRADDLQSDRQTRLVEAIGQGERGLPGRVECKRVSGPFHQFVAAFG